MKKIRNQIITLSLGILIGTTGVAFASTTKVPVANNTGIERFHDEMHEGRDNHHYGNSRRGMRNGRGYGCH